MRSPIFALLSICLTALPAGADWLVLRDGTRLETRGPWTQRGRLTVFTTATGDLSSLRTEAIDLEASRRATAAAAAPAAAPASPGSGAGTAPPTREVRRITNADIPAGRAAPAGAAAEAGGKEEGSTPPAAGGQLQVRDTAQRIDSFDSHLIVSGTLANLSQRTAAAVALTVQAYGADGELLGSEQATLGVSALTPGAATTFEADFSDIYGSAMALRFAPSAEFLETTSQEGSMTTSGEGDDGTDDGFDEAFDDFEEFDDPEP